MQKEPPILEYSQGRQRTNWRGGFSLAIGALLALLAIPFLCMGPGIFIAIYLGNTRRWDGQDWFASCLIFIIGVVSAFFAVRWIRAGMRR